MTDGKRITKVALLADIAKINAELEGHPERRTLLKSDLLQAKAAVARLEAQLMELRAREYSLKTALASCEKLLDAINKKTIEAIDKEEQRKPERARGSPHPWSPLDEPELPPVQPPFVFSAEPPKDAPKPAPVRVIPLVHVGDESKEWTPQDWAAYYRTGQKPEPKPAETEKPKELSITEEPEKTPLDGEVTR